MTSLCTIYILMKIVHRVHKKDNKSNEKVNYISKINETVSLKLQCKMVASDKTSSKIQKKSISSVS